MLLPAKIFTQHVDPFLVTQLPDTLNESSGLELTNTNSIWSHNDSDDSARIYNFDTLGNLLRVVNFIGVSAIDFEDIAQDENGNFYIGDFGNNDNDRDDLCIYKIPNPNTLLSDSIIPEIIHFSYPDQFLFPPDTTYQNFDCEAMFHFNNSLYLFSKNHGTSTYCRMYQLPDISGSYVAQLVDSFDTQGWITSADISPSGKVISLLSETNLWLFTNFSGDDFFGGTFTRLSMDYTKKEAIVFINDSAVYISDEISQGTGSNLYTIDLSHWVGIDEINSTKGDFYIFPNPGNKFINITSRQNQLIKQINIYSQTGYKIRTIEEANNKIDISILKPGLYFAEIKTSEGNFVRKIVVQ